MTEEPRDIEVGMLENPRGLLGKERWQVLRTLTEPEFRSLKSGIAEDGVVSSVVLDRDGRLIDGHHRVRAWCELADGGVTVPPIPYQKRNDLTDAREIRLLARKLNMQRRQLTQEERREVIRTQIAETPERSDGWIADDLGADHVTVTKWRLAGTGRESHDLPDPDLLPRVVIGRDGKEYEYPPRKNIEEEIARLEAEKSKAEEPSGEEDEQDEDGGTEEETRQRGTTTAEDLKDADPDSVPKPPEPEPENVQHFYKIAEFMASLSQMDPEEMAAIPLDLDGAYNARRTADSVIEWFGDYRAALQERERGQLRLVKGDQS